MHKFLLPLLAIAILLTGCNTTPVNVDDLTDDIEEIEQELDALELEEEELEEDALLEQELFEDEDEVVDHDPQ